MTDEQGFHQLCCVAAGDGNNLRDTKGERLHVSRRLTDAEVLNSPGMKAVRKQMAEGAWPGACERCRQAEESGAASVRQHHNARFGRTGPEEFLRRTGRDGSLESPVVRYADIRLGNACNLTCRMCTPVASRLIAPHFNEIRPPAYHLPEAELKVLAENNWVKKEPVAWLLEQSLPSVEGMHFAGGEPLIVPEMADALDFCVRSGRAGEIDLSYNTNLTVLPERVTSQWKHFRGVTLFCSVDGYGKLNEYIRRPSKWNDIDRNLRELDRRADEWNVRSATVSVTVQIYNALTIHELFEYMRTAEFSRLKPLPQLIPLFYPPYLSIQALPPRAKAIARRRLEAERDRAQSWNRPELSDIIGTIRAVIAFMDEADATDRLSDFRAFCEASDRVYGDDWREAAPELAAILEES